MKKLLFALPVVLLVAAGCNPPTTQPTTQATPTPQQQVIQNPTATSTPTAVNQQISVPKDWESYSNVDWGFSISYPNQTLWFETNGTFGDRRHMVVEAKPHTNVRYHVDEVAQPGQFLSQREDPNMAKIIAKPVFAFSLELNFEGETIVVSEKDDEESNLIDVSVWGWHGQAVDEGDEAADWMSRVMERPVRLVRASSKKPRFVEGNKDLGVVNFSDGYPLLVTSVGSIAAVNKRLVENGKSPVDHARFRPNIVLGGNDEPFIEDRIKSFEFEAGMGSEQYGSPQPRRLHYCNTVTVVFDSDP
jgi:uncharacterized protein YcbX